MLSSRHNPTHRYVDGDGGTVTPRARRRFRRRTSRVAASAPENGQGIPIGRQLQWPTVTIGPTAPVAAYHPRSPPPSSRGQHRGLQLLRHYLQLRLPLHVLLLVFHVLHLLRRRGGDHALSTTTWW